MVLCLEMCLSLVISMINYQLNWSILVSNSTELKRSEKINFITYTF